MPRIQFGEPSVFPGQLLKGDIMSEFKRKLRVIHGGKSNCTLPKALMESKLLNTIVTKEEAEHALKPSSRPDRVFSLDEIYEGLEK